MTVLFVFLGSLRRVKNLGRLEFQSPFVPRTLAYFRSGEVLSTVLAGVGSLVAVPQVVSTIVQRAWVHRPSRESPGTLETGTAIGH